MHSPAPLKRPRCSLCLLAIATAPAPEGHPVIRCVLTSLRHNPQTHCCRRFLTDSIGVAYPEGSPRHKPAACRVEPLPMVFDPRRGLQVVQP
jgi:hypothetical protein